MIQILKSAENNFKAGTINMFKIIVKDVVIMNEEEKLTRENKTKREPNKQA